MISFLGMNASFTKEELYDLPIHELNLHIENIKEFKKAENAALLGDNENGAS